MAAAAVVGGADERADPTDVSTQTYDRVVRIVSWVFLLATTTIVAVTGLWPENQPAILVLLALAGHVRARRPRPAAGGCARARPSSRVEGSVAITVATLLVALTGGVQSPFFFTYPLIVGGAALVVSPADHRRPGRDRRARLPAGGRRWARPRPDLGMPATTATVGINLTAMILLAYVAMVIAREQRRSRDAAIRLSTIDPLTGAVQPRLLLRRPRARDRPQRPVGPRVLPADDGPRRAQGGQRPARALPRRPGPARASARS